METQHSQSFLQKRKMLVFLPVVVVPFMAVMFGIFGGGKGVAKSQDASNLAMGINTSIPDVSSNTEIYDSKMKAYDKAHKDSMTVKSRTPISFLEGGMEQFLDDSSSVASSDSQKGDKAGGNLNFDVREEKSSPERLSLIEAEKNIEEARRVASGSASSNQMSLSSGQGSSAPQGKSTATRTRTYTKNPDGSRSYSSSYSASTDGQPMSAMELQIHEQIEKNRQLQELVMKKIEKDMNGPAEQSAAQSNTTNSSSKESKKVTVKVKTIEKPLVEMMAKKTGFVSDTVRMGRTPRANNGFYSPGKNGKPEEGANIIYAAIHGTQTVENGSTVKMRLLQSIQIGRTVIPAHSYIFGIASVSGQRLQMRIEAIHYKDMLLPVNFAIYDIDGIEGLSMPASVTRTAVKQGASQGIGSTNFIGASPTVESQLTQSAIEVVKNVASKKAQTVRVTLKSDYQVLLLPSEQNQ